jgi:hypothetical protein
MDAAKADLIRDLGRLARGLSALFWGLPLTLMVNVETARTDRLDFLGAASFVPAVIFNALLWHGLRQMRGFQKQERIWQKALYRAEVFAAINIGLAPFLYWWHRFPAVQLYVVCVDFLSASSLLFLVHLNQVLHRLSAMLPDEMLRAETKTYTSCNIWMLLAVLAGLSLYIAFGPLQVPDVSWGDFHLRPRERALWVALFLTLMPVAMTMALLWKIKEAIFTGLFAVER